MFVNIIDFNEIVQFRFREYIVVINLKYIIYF